MKVCFNMLKANIKVGKITFYCFDWFYTFWLYFGSSWASPYALLAGPAHFDSLSFVYLSLEFISQAVNYYN